MDTLHAYNLQNETFFHIGNETRKERIRMVCFKNQVIQQLYYEVKYDATWQNFHSKSFADVLAHEHFYRKLEKMNNIFFVLLNVLTE